MANGDATAELLSALDDRSRYEFVPGVPVFQAHERHFPEQRLPDGTVVPARTVKVTDADLYAIAGRMNASIAATGHLPPLTEGHRRFGAVDESEQPRLLGFARNYRVDWCVRDGGRFLAILEDEYVKVGCREALAERPYRSLEYNPDTGTGEGTAFLLQPPFLKMGTTCLYQHHGGPTVPDPAKPDDWTDDDTRQYAAWCKYMKKYSGEAGVGPGNATTPPPVTQPPAGYQAAAVPATYAAQLADLNSRLAASEKARTEAECRAMLDPLNGRVKFDYQRELGTLVGLPTAEARVAHCSYMVDTYQTLPTGSLIPVYQGTAHLPAPAADGDPSRPPAGYDRVMTYMRAHPGMTYEAAKAAVAQQK